MSDLLVSPTDVEAMIIKHLPAAIAAADLSPVFEIAIRKIINQDIWPELRREKDTMRSELNSQDTYLRRVERGETHLQETVHELKITADKLQETTAALAVAVAENGAQQESQRFRSDGHSKRITELDERTRNVAQLTTDNQSLMKTVYGDASNPGVINRIEELIRQNVERTNVQITAIEGMFGNLTQSLEEIKKRTEAVEVYQQQQKVWVTRIVAGAKWLGNNPKWIVGALAVGGVSGVSLTTLFEFIKTILGG